MICGNCGKQIGDQEKFCRYCGSPQGSPEPAPKRKSKKKWIAAGILAAAAVAALAVFLVLRNGPGARFEQALKDGDYDRVLELYQKESKEGKLPEDIEELMEEAMRQLYREYSSEEMDSHEISEVLKRMGEIFTGALSVKAGAVESLVEGDENFRRENWEQAAVFYQSALESWPELEEASEGLEKAAGEYRGQILDAVETYVSEEKYVEALEELEHGLTVLKSDPELEDKREEVSQAYETYQKNQAVVSVEFTSEYENSRQYAVIRGLNQAGEEIWKKETEHFLATELDRVNEIGMREEVYYYAAGGTVTALDLQSGEVLWENEEFQGASLSYSFGSDGQLYLCGYYGPDFFAVDQEGNTLCRIDSFSAQYQWPHGIRCSGEQAVVTVSEAASGEEAEITVNLSDYSFELPEVPEQTPEAAAQMTLEEICRAVENYYNTAYHTEDYVVFENEAMETDGGYFLILRYQGGNTANVMASGIQVNTETGKVKDDWDGVWNLYG